MGDVRLALRSLRNNPGFTAVVVFTLALGIGANTAIFSVVNAVLLNPGGISHPERVVAVRVRYDKLGLNSINVSVPDFADVHNSKQIFDNAAVMDGGDFAYTAGPMPERLQGALVSSEWFDVFSAKPTLGRLFRPEEDQPNANQEVILAYSVWKRLFGADPGVLDRTIELNNKLYRVVGVMGPEFNQPSQTDIWTPIALEPQTFSEDSRFNERLFAVARLKAGLSIGQANTFSQILSDRVRNGKASGAYAKDSSWSMFATPMTDFLAGDSKKPLLVLLVAVGFVLLIACSNIAGLSLARASGRMRELAIQSALGAGRWDLIRKSAIESLLLACAGALLGLAIASNGISLLLTLAPERLVAGITVPIDGHVLLFTATLSVVAALLFGTVPALQSGGTKNFASLKEGGRSGTAGRARQNARAALVIGEIALALVLLVGAGLFIRSLSRLQEVGTGFDSSGVETATLSLPQSRYQEPERLAAFYRAVTLRLANIPGVVSAAPAMPLPFSGNESSASFSVQGRTAAPGDPGPHADIRWVGPDLFKTLRIPLRSGRVFTDQDRIGSEPVVVIDENLAQQYWAGQNPVGQHVRRGSSQPWATVIGVVGHVKHSDLSSDAGKGVYYTPMFQQPTPFSSFAVRTTSNPANLAGAIREAVRAIDPTLPVHHLKTMQELIAGSLAARRFVVTVLGFFALVALSMAAIGLYGVITYSVTQRTQEIGIRMALGAQRGEVLAMVAGQGIRLAGLGVAIGFLVAFALSGIVASQLYQVSAFDPLTFLLTAAVLIVSALVACVIPARRAARVDPMIALRYE